MDPPAHLVERIRAAFPSLRLASARLDPDGLVNTVLIIDEQWVCRFSKDERGLRALAREAQILALVRHHVDLAVPAFEYQEADFVAYRLIEGRPLFRHDLVELDDRQQDHLADQLATFLYELHTVPEAELERHMIGSSDAQRTPEDWERLYGEVERELFPLLWRDQRDWVVHHFAPIQTAQLDLGYRPVLIHGDLAQYHILYQGVTADLMGIIDLGTAGLRPGGLFIAAAPSRHDSPELADVLQVGPALIAAVFGGVEAWDGPYVRLPDTDAVRRYLVGRGVGAALAADRATRATVPLTITKRGALLLARKSTSHSGRA